jgi:predicted TIM-barrel fold metal-dependent hydrolase
MRFKKRITDFHTHAFPDSIAERAMEKLEGEADIEAFLDGRLSSLLDSMDRNGIERSVVASIATKPGQFESIFEWSKAIASERIVPFISIHPDDPLFLTRLELVRRNGIKGVKLHPYYQGFVYNEERMLPLYEKMQELGLILLAHTGFDIAFEEERIADPERIIEVWKAFPNLKVVTSHFGAWKDWDAAEKHIMGRPIYMDISYSFEYMDRDQARRFLAEHPEEYLLFGTDSPWGDQGETLRILREMVTDEARLDAMLWENASRLLDAGRD